MKELPTGWEWTTIDEVAATSLGKMLDKKQATGLHPTPYLRNINVRWGSVDLSDLAEMDIRPEELDRVLAQPGDVIACEGGEPGRAAVWQGPGTIALQKALHRIRPCSGIAPDYLALLLRHLSTSQQLTALLTGTTIKHLPQEKLRVVAVPLPPQAEQPRIVAALAAHLSTLDAADAWVKESLRRVRLLNQRLVDSAIEGAPARLRELLSEPLRNGVSAKAASDGSVRVVTLTAVTRSEFTDENTKLIDPGPRSVEDLWMRRGDLFIQRSNTPELVGSAALYCGPERWAIFPDLLIRVRVDLERIDPAYLEAVLRSTALRRYFQGSAQGIAGSMPKISQPIVEAAPIPVPSLERQQSVLRQLQSERETLGRVSAELSRIAGLSAALRRAVFAAAFTGQLVPQDPDDEPASVLLERIREEREAAPARTRRTRS